MWLVPGLVMRHGRRLVQTCFRRTTRGLWALGSNRPSTHSEATTGVLTDHLWRGSDFWAPMVTSQMRFQCHAPLA